VAVIQYTFTHKQYIEQHNKNFGWINNFGWFHCEIFSHLGEQATGISSPLA